MSDNTQGRLGLYLSGVVDAGRRYLAALEKWNPHLGGSGNDASLPGFPQQHGNELIIETIFDIERALNPGCHPQHSSQRLQWRGASKNREVRLGHKWLFELHDRLLERWQLTSLCKLTCSNFDFLFRHAESPNILAESSLQSFDFPISPDEYKALERSLKTIESGLQSLNGAPSKLSLNSYISDSLSRASDEDRSKDRDGELKLKPCESKAYQSYIYAIENYSDLKNSEFQVVYEWLKDNGSPFYKDPELPEFDTWNSHRRKAFQKLKLPPRNQPRAGRAGGKSVVDRERL